MPFPLRTVSPLRLCRLEEEVAAASASAPPTRDKGGSGSGLRFGSLESVCAHSLASLLWQLSDLSRCARDVFGGIQSEADRLGHRGALLQRRLDALKAQAARLDHRRVRIPVSNLDEESRWTVHYTAPWHQQENVFLPSSRPQCVEDLHRQAKLNLKSVLRECDKLRRDGYRSSQYYSQGPTFSSSSSVTCGNYQDDYEEIGQKCSTPSPEEEKLITIKKPNSPISSELSNINTQTNWTKSLPLPTPEEKMRQQAQAVQTDVIPINITGENFDRQASIRSSLICTDTVVRRPKKVKRRKTITGIPDNIQRELVGTGKSDFRSHSLCVPDRYSTLGRLDSYCSSVHHHCDTKDSSCQTEEVKVVPPSVRRIRAQKGQGIAAQMSLLSSSSGNMSVMSDSAGVVFPSRLNSDLGFHSLPRPGARVSLQLLERRHSLSKSTEDGNLSHQGSRLQENGSIDHMRNSNRTDKLPRTKSQEVRSPEREQAGGQACMVSPHATFIIPNATLSSSSEVIAIHTTHNVGSMDRKITSSSSYSKPRDNLVANSIANTRNQHNSSSGTWSETSSTHHSHSSDTISSNAVTGHALADSRLSLSGARTLEKEPQNLTYNCRNDLNFPSHSQDSKGLPCELSYSGGKRQVSVQNSAEYSGSKHSGIEDIPLQKLNSATPSCSTPVSPLSVGSLERVSAKEDASSLYSVDHDGYYTSMHVDSGLKTSKACSNNGFGNPRHSVTGVFDGAEKKSLGDLSNYSDKSLSRSISLRKAKKPPLPPSRTDSLRRIPKKKSQSNGQVLDDALIASLQQSLQLNLKSKNGSSPSQSPCSDYDDPWVLRSRSQSSVSASSSMMSAAGLNMYSICAVTPTQSETSSIKSEYADQWGYYSDCPGMSDDQLKSPAAHSAPKLNDYNNASISHLDDRSKASAPHGPSGSSKPKVTSPEKSHRVTSPSSGYSSQSNTPTALTPVPIILKSMSTGNGRPKMKPKVPERKSSLLSSVSMSSSSTSLSSNTSAEGSVSFKKPDPELSFPAVIPSPIMFPDAADLLFPPPPPPLAVDMDLSPRPGSPSFPPPPPPPEAVMGASLLQNVSWANCQDSSVSHLFPSSLPLPPPPLLPCSVLPPAPPLDPKYTKDPCKLAPYSSTKYIQEGSYHSTVKHSLNTEELLKPVMPLVTTQALQMVQLRSVRKGVVLEAEESINSTSKTHSQEKVSEVFSAQSSLKPCMSVEQNETVGDGKVEVQRVCERSFVYGLSQKSYPSISDGRPEHNSNKMPGNAANLAQSFATDLSQARTEEVPEQNQGFHCDFVCSTLQGESEFLSKPEGMSPNKKPPPVSKKPKLFLMVPPPHPDVAAEKIDEVGETARSSPSVTINSAAVEQHCQAEDYPADGLSSFEMDSGHLVPEGGAVSFLSCDTREGIVSTLQPTHQEQTCLWEGISADENGDNLSKPNRQLFQGDESAEVFESNAANMLLLQNPVHEEDSEMVAMPTRPRTTEDLFAAIHRSKRKVLGRKDSEDDCARNHSPSPPVTPTGASPNLSSLKQAGLIQRSIRKSSTSNDNFKALLLKKGSRSDTGFRMSAAEMLKNTDPRSQRAKVDSPWDNNDNSTSSSPTKNRRSQEEWARSEGLMPRSLSFSSTRYSRSRTPPSAASSKYNVRNRIQSSPMTVISEGEMEAMDPGESRTHKSLEEGLDVFDNDEIDINEDGSSSDNTAVHPDLIA